MSRFPWPILLIGPVIVVVILLVANAGEESPAGACSYANNFTDSVGQTWSATDIEAENVGCMEAIKVAVNRAEESVGLPANVPAGWACERECFKGKARVRFQLTLE